MRPQHSGCYRVRVLRSLGVGPAGHSDSVFGEGRRDGVASDRSGTKDVGWIGRAVDDRRFKADFAGPAIEDCVDFPAEVGHDVASGGWTDFAKAVRRGRRQTATSGVMKFGEQSQRGRMTRHADHDGCSASGHIQRDDF